jgi:hypothetical protein
MDDIGYEIFVVSNSPSDSDNLKQNPSETSGFFFQNCHCHKLLENNKVLS